MLQERYDERQSQLAAHLRTAGLSDHHINSVDPYDESTVPILEELLKIIEHRDAHIKSLELHISHLQEMLVMRGVILKKKRKKGKGKKGKQPVKQVVDDKPLPSGHVCLRKIPGCNGIQSPIFGRWYNPVVSNLSREWNNHMGGMLGRHLYWSNASNTVFTGSTARAATQAALDDREFTIDYKTGVYHAAQWGLPMNPIEVDKLIKLDVEECDEEVDKACLTYGMNATLSDLSSLKLAKLATISVWFSHQVDRPLIHLWYDHHLHALQLHGVPPAIPEFNGWTLPSKIDLIRMYYFKSRIHSEKNCEIMDASGWRITFGSLYPNADPNPSEQEAPPLDETVEPDSLPLDNEPADIDAPELTSMMVNMLPYGEDTMASNHPYLGDGITQWQSNASNTVFAGSTARATAQAALDDREFMIDYKTGVYHTAQWGLPMNPIEVEGYILLVKLYQIAHHIDERYRDDVMIHPGAANMIHGLIFDYQHTVNHQSVWGYAIAQFFMPEDLGKGHTSQVQFTCLMAILMVTPGLYRSHIDLWNEHHPEQPFITQTGETRYYQCLVLTPGASANLTLDTVAKVLIHNGIDPREINHSYTFGVNYLDQIYIDDPIHCSLFNVADDHRLHALQLHGVPPAIPEFNGWTLPSKIDLIQMYYFESRIHSEENRKIMDTSGWRITSGSLYKSLGLAAPLSSLNPNIAGSSSPAPGNGFAAIEQEAPPLDEMVEPDSLPLDNEPADIDAPKLTSMMVDTLPYGEASPATMGHTTPEPQSTSEDISSSDFTFTAYYKCEIGTITYALV
ncbi:hypothetical protein P691DRAFT_780621 [Macrolepiota fuliginosa MF-IS2]|uniref:Uncharacterized protein n=1 Tax=Macrolepiota fuliginosa MF-IS2 TaxID=1400762 RepID=A0A9P6BVT3_9AGAR|nr:hypothetical protein P691DRAFT_780621 [Macrolepiota fuliginosa MF-IS2]